MTGAASTLVATPEDFLDQLRTLLDREVIYARQDYIGCFEQDCNLSFVPGEDSNVDEPTERSTVAYTRRTKQSRTQKNSSVNSKCSRKSCFNERHRTRLCEWIVEGTQMGGSLLQSLVPVMDLIKPCVATKKQ